MYPINLRSGVTENILTSIYDVDPQHTYRQLNRQIYDESKMSFYQQYCDKPITTSEIISYVNTKPKKIGIVILTDGHGINHDRHYTFTQIQYGYLTKQALRNRYHGEGNTIDIVLEGRNHNVYNDFIDWEPMDMNELVNMTNTNLDYDLLTIYNIYKARKDCMRVNPLYAKNKVLGFLNQLSIIPQQSLFDIYYYYEYLLLNYFVFDIMDGTYGELKPLALKPKNPLLLEDATKTEVMQYLSKAMDDPLDNEVYHEFKHAMIIEFNQLLNKVIDHININL